MGTRKSLLLDQKSMTFKGVTDLGDNAPKNVETEMADHALVLISQPLYDNYAQPISVFASKGPVHGEELVKIVVQAIVLLENAGVKIHGVISDGGSPNRKMWDTMGCGGKIEKFKNFFMHPLDDQCKVFFFWDTPHLMKCIRNRLANIGTLKVHTEQEEIKWGYFKVLFDLDKAQLTTARICPKLTEAHIDIANKSMLKMRVSLAVQIFSKSVARSLQFYRKFDERLKHSVSTERFCTLLNDMFDALNKTFSEGGLTLGCAEIKILEDCLH